MGYQAGGTDYHLDTRQRALDKTTEAKRREAESARERRIRQSGQRSDAQKLLSAAARGAAAYFTSGMSETMGGGAMIDQAMLGTDSEGKAVRNEYGDLVGMASKVGGAMSAQKVADAALQLKNQSKADQAMQTRLDNLDPSGRLGMEYALRLEDKNTRNTAALQKHKGGFMGLLNKDVEGLDLKPTTMGDWETVLAKAQTPKAKTPDYIETETFQHEGGGFLQPKKVTEVDQKGQQASFIDEALAKKQKQDEELKAMA